MREMPYELGLSWAKLSSNWNWNLVLLHFPCQLELNLATGAELCRVQGKVRLVSAVLNGIRCDITLIEKYCLVI